MSYDISTHFEPFWAKSGDFVRGRDPLGIQNSSISVYSLLLPGMTNLTLRLRYYGFYLWLLDEYHKLPSTSDFKKNVRGQYNFIRRAELLLSYFMVNKFPTEQSVVGSDFANKNSSQLPIQSYYDIALGADKLSATIKGSVYWDYTSGAFGQYYVGSLMALQLVDSKTGGYFERTEKGLKLANAYSESIINSDAKNLFLKRINEGKLYAEDIDLLMDFSLNKDINTSTEEDFYFSMLLDNDGEKNKKTTGELPIQRKETMILFLEFLSANKDPNAWKNLPITLYSAYQHSSNQTVNEAQLGWYYYYLNELVHYSLEAIFWGMLTEMERKSQTIQTFIEYMAQSVTEHKQDNIEELENLSVSDVISEITKFKEKTHEYIDNIDKDVRNKESISGIAEGIFFLLKLYNDSKLTIGSLEQYATDYALFDKNGNALAVFKKYIIANNAAKFPDFVKNIIRSLINEHTAIAYRKMGNGEKNLLKFIIEDNYLVHIETMKPNFTSPRLRTLYNFSIDLGLITKEGTLSEKANQLITENT
jgi:hypothetical protein